MYIPCMFGTYLYHKILIAYLKCTFHGVSVFAKFDNSSWFLAGSNSKKCMLSATTALLLHCLGAALRTV